MRILYLIAGWLSLLLGFIGVFLPLLPTTPFVILASFCFARSSPRFHSWMHTNRYIGPYLNDWEQYRRIPRRAKYVATVTIMLGFVMANLLIQAAGWVVALQAVILLTMLGFIWAQAD